MTEPKRLTDEELREIEQRAELATKGPWVIISIDDVFAYVCFDSLPYKVAEVLSLRDAEFIAHAREDVPRLVEEVRRLNSELTRIWEIIDGSSYYGEFERAYEQLKELEGGE